MEDFVATLHRCREASINEPTDDDVCVKETLLKNCNFLGLFANRSYKKDDVICKYYGTILTTKEAMNLEDKSYLMRLGEQCYIDAKDHLEVRGR